MKLVSKTTAAFAMVTGATSVAIGAFALAFALDTTEVDAAAMAGKPAPIAVEPACGRTCTSYVIASPVPGDPARVVDGASAFGMALDPGAAATPVTDPSRPKSPAAPRIDVEVNAGTGVSVGAFGALTAVVAGASGGYAVAALIE